MNNLFYLSFVLILSVFLKSVTVIAEYVDKDQSLKILGHNGPRTEFGLEYHHVGDNQENREQSGGVPDAAKELPKDNFGYQHVLKDTSKDTLEEKHEGYKTVAQEAKNVSKKQKRAALPFLQKKPFSDAEISIEYAKKQGGRKENSEEFERKFNLLVSELLNGNAKSTIFNRLAKEIIYDYRQKIDLTDLRSGRTSISFDINFANDEDSVDIMCDSFSFSLQTFYDTEQQDFKKGYFEAYLINGDLDKYGLNNPDEQLTVEQKVERRRNQCNAARLQYLNRNKNDEPLFESIKHETYQNVQQSPTFQQTPVLQSSWTPCPPCGVNCRRTYDESDESDGTFIHQGHIGKEFRIIEPSGQFANQTYRNNRHVETSERDIPIYRKLQHETQQQQQQQQQQLQREL